MATILDWFSDENLQKIGGTLKKSMKSPAMGREDARDTKTEVKQSYPLKLTDSLCHPCESRDPGA
jgi:hypothetical protein